PSASSESNAAPQECATAPPGQDQSNQPSERCCPPHNGSHHDHESVDPHQNKKPTHHHAGWVHYRSATPCPHWTSSGHDPKFGTTHPPCAAETHCAPQGDQTPPAQQANPPPHPQIGQHHGDRSCQSGPQTRQQCATQWDQK